MELSSLMVTSMFEQKPAIASSIELSTVLLTKMVQTLSLMSPMYIAGRLRTALKAFEHLDVTGRVVTPRCSDFLPFLL